eukprot:6483080-Amphidinium_carterae.1
MACVAWVGVFEVWGPTKEVVVWFARVHRITPLARAGKLLNLPFARLCLTDKCSHSKSSRCGGGSGRGVCGGVVLKEVVLVWFATVEQARAH